MNFFLSKERVGQGDSLSMLLYAAAAMPLIKSLSNGSKNRHADDSSWTAKLTHLREWFDKLCEHGPKLISGKVAWRSNATMRYGMQASLVYRR